MNLRRIWSNLKPAGDGDGACAAEELDDKEQGKGPPLPPPAPRSLPLLQVWPSQDSPRGEADGQSFVYPVSDDSRRGSATSPLSPAASPPAAPVADAVVPEISNEDSYDQDVEVGCPPLCHGGSGRRPSSALLHPDHARLFRGPSPDVASVEDGFCASNSSSTASSLNSIAASTPAASRESRGRPSEPWFLMGDRRRSSTMTARFSLLDALDFDNAIRAARGSIGHYSMRSWSESLHKLTFTQSLAFPALARGMASKRPSAQLGRRRNPDPADTGLNAFAKVVTALVLVLVSVLVFFVVYKFART